MRTIHGTVDHDGTLPPTHSIRITHSRLYTPLYQPPVQSDTDNDRNQRVIDVCYWSLS